MSPFLLTKMRYVARSCLVPNSLLLMHRVLDLKAPSGIGWPVIHPKSKTELLVFDSEASKHYSMDIELIYILYLENHGKDWFEKRNEYEEPTSPFHAMVADRLLKGYMAFRNSLAQSKHPAELP